MTNRQLITGVLLALAFFVGYHYVVSLVFPPRPPASQPATGPSAVETAPDTVASTRPASTPTLTEAPQTLEPAQPKTPTTTQADYVFQPGSSETPLQLGGREEDLLALTLTPRGAAVESILLTSRKKGRYVYRAEAESNEPYEVVSPVEGLDARFASFATSEIRIAEFDNRSWRLDRLVWEVTEATPTRAGFTATLQSAGDGRPLLRLHKTYELQEGKPLVKLGLRVENLSDRPLNITLIQDSATGIRRESPMYEMRRLLAAKRTAEGVETAKAVQRDKLRNRNGQAQEIELYLRKEDSFAWTALANRFFGVFLRPLPAEEGGCGKGDFIRYAEGTVLLPERDEKLGDLVARLWTDPTPIQPRQAAGYAFEVYAGPKDPDILEEVNPAYVEPTGVYYTLAHAADQRCCTFEPLPQIMIALLHGIRYVVRNYGVAIIILVILVRTLLHPLTVYQQKQMYRMQDAMARLQPKLQLIKEKYANDKVRLNQEMMKLYSEEGVNPMGSVVSMLPLLIQMPILVALWTGLNTDVALRHAPFDGWWITDLAAPDAFIRFSHPITIPLLGHLPLVGRLFQDIPSLNLLPLLMGVSMWLQQKYMPKPGAQARRDAAAQAAAPRKPGQLSPEDQIRQQQMMAYMMSVLFPLMFYYMPSGLNLYWMATNVFGIGESLIIRKQLREEKEKQARLGEGPRPRQPGFFSRMLKRMAEQAEELQRKADALAERDPRQRKPDDKNRKRR